MLQMPPKKRPVPKHTGKLPRREASVITSVEPTAAALPSAVSSEAVAAVVTPHLERSGRLLSASTETVLPPCADTLSTMRPARASRLSVSTSHRSVPMPSTRNTVPPMPSTSTAVTVTWTLYSAASSVIGKAGQIAPWLDPIPALIPAPLKQEMLLA